MPIVKSMFDIVVSKAVVYIPGFAAWSKRKDEKSKRRQVRYPRLSRAVSGGEAVASTLSGTRSLAFGLVMTGLYIFFIFKADTVNALKSFGMAFFFLDVGIDGFQDSTKHYLKWRDAGDNLARIVSECRCRPCPPHSCRTQMGEMRLQGVVKSPESSERCYVPLSCR